MSRRPQGPHERARTGDEAPGRRWAYLELDVHVETWTDSAGRSGRLPTVEVGAARLPAVAPLLNDLGADGWELAGAIGSHSPLIFRLFLKRRTGGSRPHA